MTHRPFVLSCLVALSVALGCGAFERWACGEPCRGGVNPVLGSSQDFELQGYAQNDAMVLGPQRCEADQDLEVEVIHVVTHGEDTDIVAAMWVVDRLLPELRARGVGGLSSGVGACTNPDDPGARPGFRIGTDDWTLVDEIVALVVELATEDDVAVTVTLAVAPTPILCPDDDCGT